MVANCGSQSDECGFDPRFGWKGRSAIRNRGVVDGLPVQQ